VASRFASFTGHKANRGSMDSNKKSLFKSTRKGYVTFAGSEDSRGSSDFDGDAGARSPSRPGFDKLGILTRLADSPGGLRLRAADADGVPRRKTQPPDISATRPELNQAMTNTDLLNTPMRPSLKAAP
jgi:hypothetical protein